MARARRELAAPQRRLHDCPACRKQTPHELRLQRRGIEVLVCSVCELVSLVSADEARPEPEPKP